MVIVAESYESWIQSEEGAEIFVRKFTEKIAARYVQPPAEAHHHRVLAAPVQISTLLNARRQTGDVLTFYQHQTNRKGTPWVDEQKAHFERAIGLLPGGSKLAWAPSIAKDVVFFFAAKSSVSKEQYGSN